MNIIRRIVDLKSFNPRVMHEFCFIWRTLHHLVLHLCGKTLGRALNVNSWRGKSKNKRAYSGCAKKILNKADLSAPEQGTGQNQRLNDNISFQHPFYYVAVCAFI